uniref:Uncharacterized protein n=1 Tax=Ditylenchus dipsaci TaxID=166011 RepID=A0A915CMP3_9BILA
MSSLFNLFRCGRKKLKQNKAGRLESHQVLEKDNSDQIELSLRSCSISSSLTACGKEFQQSSSDGLEITNNQRLSAVVMMIMITIKEAVHMRMRILTMAPATRPILSSRLRPLYPDLPPAQIYDLASVQPIGFEAVQKNSSETVEPPQSRMISAEVAPANVQPLGLEAIGQSSAKGFIHPKRFRRRIQLRISPKNKISGSLKSAKEPSKDDIDNNRPLARTYASSPVQISFKDVGSVKSVSKRQNSAPSSRNWDKVNAIKSSRKVRAKASRGNEVRPKRGLVNAVDCKLSLVSFKCS